MSIKNDPEALANVPTPSGDQEALYLSDAGGWYSKIFDGTSYALAGLTQVGPYGTTPNANAAVVAGDTLNLQTGNATFAGLLSTTNYGNINNYFGRIVFDVEDYGVLPGNTAAANVTAMNTLLQTTATEGAIIQFGPYTYQFNAGLTTLTKDFCFRGVYGQTTIAITADMGSGVPFLKFLNTGFYTSVMDLNFVNFATQTTNYAIMAQNNANPQFINCFFTGASNWSGILDFTGTSAGNGAVIKNLYVSQFSAKCMNVVSPLSTMYIEDTLILGAGVANTIGLYCSDGGAVLMSNCQMITCDVNVKLDPANGKTVSAIFAVNCFFDQGKTNCMLITGAGTGTVARCHFVGCWFTISASGSNTKCIEITSAGSGIHAGIQFQCCEIMNATAGSTGTLYGIFADKVQDITVSNSQFAGWTTDVSVTPASTGTLQVQLSANDFSNWGLITGSANNVILDAGSFTYGQVNIVGNVFGGTTTRLTNNAAIAVGAQRLITGNTGLAQPGIDVVGFQTTNANLTASALNLITGTSIRLPTNGLWVGSRIRFHLGIQKLTAAGTATWTCKVKFGTANTTADTEICSWTSGTNTAAVDGANVIVDIRITAVGSGTSATCAGQVTYHHQLLAATGLGSLGPAPTLTTAFNSTLADPYMHIDITPGASAVMTCIGTAEVVI